MYKSIPKEPMSYKKQKEKTELLMVFYIEI